MTSHVWRITLPDFDARGEGRRQRFINFETAHSTLDDLADALNRGVVVGQELWTRRTDEAGVFEVWRRTPLAITRHRVAAVEAPTVRFVEFEDGVP